MDNATCTEDNCERPVSIKSRRLCSFHYGREYRSGRLLISSPVSQGMRDPGGSKHRITAADAETRTGTCVVCGPGVPVRYRPDRASECLTVRRQFDAMKRGEDWRQVPLGAPRRRRQPSPENAVRYANKFLSQDERAQLLHQDASCEICASRKRLVVDHSHRTGAIRGVLCNRCNVALGWLNDSTSSILAAWDYLMTRPD